MTQNRKNITVGYIREPEIRQKANNFLRHHNPDETLPVPLEHIVEFSLGINLLTVPNLKDHIECDGFISSDFKIITIDDYIFNSVESRSRFTLAHELGHLVLHRDLYEKERIKDLQGFIDFQNRLGSDGWKSLEIQANMFASCLLFPDKAMKAKTESAIATAEALGGFTVLDLQDLIIDIQNTFGVSDQAAVYELKKYAPDLLQQAKGAIF